MCPAIVDKNSQADRYRRLVNFGRSLHGVVQLRPLLNLIADEARLVLEAERCSIFVVDEEHHQLWTQLAHGMGEQKLRVPIDKGIVGRVVATGRPIRVSDAYRSPDFNPEIDRASGFNTRNILAVPFIAFDGSVFGVFEVLNKLRGEDFDDEDEGLLQILAGLTGAAIESAQLYDALRDSYLETLHRLALTAEFRDQKDTAGHLRRISGYSRSIAKRIGFSQKDVDALEFASPLHDIGKVGIPDRILSKPGRYTASEFVEMKQHTVIGYQILSGAKSPLLRLAGIIAHTHHERFDGSGYPSGLMGRGIAIESQVVAAADVFDALTSARVYKSAWSFEDACRYIVQESGKQFNPLVIEAFREAADEIGATLKANSAGS